MVRQLIIFLFVICGLNANAQVQAKQIRGGLGRDTLYIMGTDTTTGSYTRGQGKWYHADSLLNSFSTGIQSVDGVSNDGGDVDFVEGWGVDITPNDGANTVTFELDSTEVATQYDLTLVSGGGMSHFFVEADGTASSGEVTDGQTVTFVGNGITDVTRSNDSIFINSTEVDGSISNEGILGVGSGSGTSSTIITNTSTGNAVTINAAGINTISESTSSNGGSITITGTEVDGSTTNEIQDITVTGSSQPFTVDLSSDASDMTLTGAGITTLTRSGNAVTITSTEVDGSTTNELQTFANTSDADEHIVTLSNSGGSFDLKEGGGVNLVTSGTTLNGVCSIFVNDESESNEIQTLTATGTTTTYGLVLNDPSGAVGSSTVNLIEGSGITIDRSGQNLTLNSTSSGADGNGIFSSSNDGSNVGNSAFDVGIPGYLNFDAGTLYINGSTNRIGIGTTSPTADLHISGSSGSFRLEPNASGSAASAIINGTTDLGQAASMLFDFKDADYASGVEQTAASLTINHEADAAQWSTFKITMPEATDADIMVGEKQAAFSNNTTESHISFDGGVAFTQNYEWTGTSSDLAIDRSYNIINVSGSGALGDEVQLPEVASTSNNWDPTLSSAQCQVGQEYTISNFRSSTNLVVRTFTGDFIDGTSATTATLAPGESLIIKCVRFVVGTGVGYWMTYN